MDTETQTPSCTTTLDESDLPAPILPSLRHFDKPPIGRKPLMGRFAHLAMGSLSPDEFRAMRREVWGATPETTDDE